jgi:hypothetical protein
VFGRHTEQACCFHLNSEDAHPASEFGESRLRVIELVGADNVADSDRHPAFLGRLNQQSRQAEIGDCSEVEAAEAHPVRVRVG